MKHILIGLMTLVAMIGLNACGSSDKTYNTFETNATVEEPYPVPDGMAIIIDDTEGSQVAVDFDNQQIVIDCGGTCGNINVGVPVE